MNARRQGDWLKGGKDATFLESVSILDIDDADSADASPYIFGNNALLGKDKARSDKVWRSLLGFALVDPAGTNRAAAHSLSRRCRQG